MANFMETYYTPEDRAEAERMKQAKELLAQQQATNPIDSSTAYVSLPQLMMPEAAKSAANAASDEDDSDEDDSSTSVSKPALKKSVLPKSAEGPTPPGLTPELSPIEKLLSDNKSEMAGAQDARNMNQLFAILGKSGSEIGSAISRAPKAADTSGFDALFKAADQPVKDIETRQDSVMKALKGSSAEQSLKNQMEQEDPNSAISKLGQQVLRDFSKSAGIPLNVTDNTSFSNALKLYPELGTMVNKRMQADALKANSSGKLDTKNDTRIDRMVKNLKDDMDPNKARGGNIAANKKKADQADYLAGLITDSGGNITNLDSRQTEELAIGLNSLLSNSNSGSVSQVKALLPKTWKGDANHLKEWLYNTPMGADQQLFVKRMFETVKREQKIALGKVVKAQRDRLGGHEELKRLSPERYAETLREYPELLHPEEEKSNSLSNDMIEVISPEGKKGQIPKSNLEKALTRGFKLSNG